MKTILSLKATLLLAVVLLACGSVFPAGPQTKPSPAPTTTSAAPAGTAVPAGPQTKPSHAPTTTSAAPAGTATPAVPSGDATASRDLVESSVPRVSVGRTVTVSRNEYIPDDLVSIGGRVIVDGEVRGDLVVIGGAMAINGKVTGDVVIVGGSAAISGVIDGDFVTVSSATSLAPGAQVHGQFQNILGSLDRGNHVRIGRHFTSIGIPHLLGAGLLPGRLFLLLFWLHLIITAIRFLGVVVVAAVAPSNIEGAISGRRPSLILAFFVGLGVQLVAIPLIILLILMCVTIPVAIVLAIALRIVKWMGMASVCLLAGRQITKSLFGRELSYFASILVAFLVFAVIGFIPVIGLLATMVLTWTGLGLMLLTRFGTNWRREAQRVAPGAPPPGPPFPAGPPAAPAPPAPPPPPTGAHPN
jgi:hypothetical protein